MLRMPRALLVVLIGIAASVPATTRHASASGRIAKIAVFPVENLTGRSIPVNDARLLLMNRVASGGIQVLGDRQLGDFMNLHRVRYAAGIDTETAEMLAREAAVDAVLIPTFELSNSAVPPKVALIARLVSLKGGPTVVWADDAGLAGDDAMGLFGLRVVNDYQVLLVRALNHLADSLLGFLKRGTLKDDLKAASKFRPKMRYRDLAIEPGRTYSVAVMPFFNLSDRRNAGEILASLFIRHLSRLEQFRVMDTGVVRAELLNARIIMDGGLSITDAETLAALIDADFVLGGRVLRYEDYEGTVGLAKVEFSTVLVDRKRRRVVWSSDSYNAGTDGVHFFERGTTRTAHGMATQMVRLTADLMARGER